MVDDMAESLNAQSIKFLQATMEKLERSMTEGFAQVHAKIDILNEHYVRRDELDRAIVRVKDTYITNLEARLASLESNQTWLVRSIIGMIVTAVIGLVVISKS